MFYQEKHGGLSLKACFILILCYILIISMSPHRLINCNLKDRSCKPLAMALGSKTSSLRLLDLSNNFIADSGVIQLSHGLRNINCKLTSLRWVFSTTQNIPARFYYNFNVCFFVNCF